MHFYFIQITFLALFEILLHCCILVDCTLLAQDEEPLVDIHPVKTMPPASPDFVTLRPENVEKSHQTGAIAVDHYGSSFVP